MDKLSPFSTPVLNHETKISFFINSHAVILAVKTCDVSNHDIIIMLDV